ncbi:MAG: NifU family protein [Sedimentisphaerales bacterium]|nr:NifU family protein [Sedimentisphaerales bacterium]
MTEEKTFDEKVKECIDEIRPLLQRDGGDCELISIEGKTVKIKFQGACQGCPGAAMTLKMGIERHMREKIPELEEVIAAN